MIKLICRKSVNDKYHQLDTDDGAKIALTFQNTEPPELFKRKASYSAAFTLPMTANNNTFFEYYNNVNTDIRLFDPRKGVLCEVYANDVLVFEGLLRLISVSTTNRTYSVNINSSTADLFINLASKQLSDLFDVVSPWDFYMDTGSVYATRFGNSAAHDITIGQMGNNVVTIPICDFGRANTGRLVYDVAENAGAANPNTDTCLPNHLRPTFQVKKLLDLIASANGIEWDYGALGSGTTSFYFTYLNMMLGTELESLPYRPWTGFKAGLSANWSMPGFSDNQPKIVPFDVDNVAPFYDPENMFDTTNHAYVGPPTAVGYLTIRGEFRVDNTVQQAGTTFTYTIRIMLAGTEVWSGPMTIPPSSVIDTNGYGNFTFGVQNLAVGPGQAVTVTLQHETGYGTPPRLVPTSAGRYTRMQLDAVGELSSQPVTMKGLMPNLTQATFVKNILMRYNYIIEPDETVPNKFLWKPAPTSANMGDPVDWTDKMDTSQQVLVEPPSQYTSRFFTMADLENDTWGSRYSNDVLGEGLGTYTLDNGDEFTNEEQRFESCFGQWTWDTIPDLTGTGNTGTINNHPIPQLYKYEDNEVTPCTFPPILGFIWTATELDNNFYIGPVGLDRLPRFGPYNQWEPDATFALTTWWNPTWETATLLGSPNNVPGFVRKYWTSTLREFYDKAGRRVTAKFYLNSTDVAKLSFRNSVRVGPNLYRLLKVTGYDPSTPSTCTVTLLRLAEPVDNDQLYPNGENSCVAASAEPQANGTVNFFNAAGGSVPATEACCNAWGYAWDGSDCYSSLRISPSRTGQGATLRPVPTVNTTDLGVGRYVTNTNLNFKTSFPNVQHGTKLDQLVKDERITGSVQRFSMQCSTAGNTYTVAVNQANNTTGIRMPSNTMVRLEINALSVDAYGTRGFGTAHYIQQVALVKHDGTGVTVVDSDQTIHQHDAGVSGRAVSVVASSVDDTWQNYETVEIRCHGERDTFIIWTVDVVATWLGFSGYGTEDTVLLYENNAPQETENNSPISTEE